MAQAPSSSPLLSLPNNPSQTPLVSSETDVPPRGPSNPSAVIAGAIVAAVILVTAAAVLFLIIRRRKRAGERSEDTSIEMGTTREEYTKEEYWSPVEKPLSPDPFMTDAQARSLGLDISRQSTRRIEARFMVVDPPRNNSPQPPRPSSASSKTMAESRSGTPTFNKSYFTREDLDSRRPAPSPSPPPPEGGDQRTMLTGAHSPSGNLQGAQLQPKMHDLIVQLGLGATRPSTPSKIMRTPHQGHSSDL